MEQRTTQEILGVNEEEVGRQKQMKFHLTYRITSMDRVEHEVFESAFKRALFIIGLSPYIDCVETWEE